MEDPKPVKGALKVPEIVFWKTPSICKSCGAEMWWWKNPKTGKNVPVNADSTSHFTTCPAANKWSRKNG
jgi:hypothetical protein